jgi:hypothetical protein
MSDSDRKGIGRKVTKDNIRLADTVLKVLEDNADSPEEACAVLVLVHAKLWTLYGNGNWDSVADMMAEYVTDFFTMMKVMEKPPPQEKGEVLH